MSTESGAVINHVGKKRSVVARKHRKRRAMEALTNESHRDLLLAMTPGRMFRTGASDNACIFTQQGRKGCNQDAMLVWEVSKQANEQKLEIRV